MATNRVLIGLAASVLAAAAVSGCGSESAGNGGATVTVRPPVINTTEPAETSPLAVARYIASDEFATRPAAEKVAFLEKAHKLRNSSRPGRGLRDPIGQLSEEERDRLHRNVRPVMKQMMMKRVTEFHALETDAERTAYIDRLIDERMARRKAHEAARKDREAARKPDGGSGDTVAGSRPRRRGPDAARMKKRIETSTPEERAQVQEFFKAVMKRMVERKISPPRRGPGPPG
jgi:hypothetical protein